MTRIYILLALLALTGCATQVANYEQMFQGNELTAKSCYVVNSPETRSKGLAGGLLGAILLGPLGAGLSAAAQDDPKLCDLTLTDAINEAVRIAYREDGLTRLIELYADYPTEITVEPVDRDGGCIDAAFKIEKSNELDSFAHSKNIRACKDVSGEIRLKASLGARVDCSEGVSGSVYAILI